jgi:hypothetical protein
MRPLIVIPRAPFRRDLVTSRHSCLIAWRGVDDEEGASHDKYLTIVKTAA